MDDMQDFNASIIAEFRANDGVVGGMFEGKPLLILHSVGAKSGQERVNPAMYREVGDDLAIFASMAGAPTNPAWYHNLVANPEATIEVGTASRDVVAREAQPQERDEIYTAMAAQYPQFAEYQDSTDRVIPVMLLRTR